MSSAKKIFAIVIGAVFFQLCGAELSLFPLFESCSVIFNTDLLPGKCKVFYRKKGEKQWLEAFETVLDSSYGEKFRTSIIGLKADTVYEVRAEHKRNSQKEILTKTFRTWAEKVPVKKTVVLTAEQVRNGLVIKDKGTPSGWIRYTAPPGVVIDGKRKNAAVVLDQARYVLLENLTIRGGSESSLRLDQCRNVRIVNCDIGFWGDPENWHLDKRSGRTRYKNGRFLWNKTAVYIHKGENIVIERCYIHDPLLSANNWLYGHPEGPQGISAFKPRSTVIRYNDICGSDLKWWNDGIAGNRNFDLDGGLNRDCDVYGNFIAFANDDAIELDGGQQNVRCYRNHIENCFMGISIQGCMTGPSYIFENRIADLGDEFMIPAFAFKTADIWGSPYAASFFYNNTTDQRGGTLQLCRNFRIVAVNNILEAIIPPVSLFGFLKTAWHHNLLIKNSGKGNFKGKAPFVNSDRGLLSLRPGMPYDNKAAAVPGMNQPFSKVLGVPQNLELPYRPCPLSLPGGRRLTFTVKKSGSAPRTLGIHAAAPVSFTVQKSADSDWYEVTPAKLSLKAGEKAVLTVRVKPEKMNTRENYRSVFFLRTPEGWSRPVSVRAVSNYKYPAIKNSEESRFFIPGAPFAPLPGGGVRFEGKGEKVSFDFEIAKSVTAFLCAEVRLPEGATRSSLALGIDTSPTFCSVRGSGKKDWQFLSLRTYKLAPGKHTLTAAPRESLDLKAFYLIFDNAVLKERR